MLLVLVERRGHVVEKDDADETGLAGDVRRGGQPLRPRLHASPGARRRQGRDQVHRNGSAARLSVRRPGGRVAGSSRRPARLRGSGAPNRPGRHRLPAVARRSGRASPVRRARKAAARRAPSSFVALAAGYAGWTLKPAAPRPITRLVIPLAEGDIVHRGSIGTFGALAGRHAAGLHGQRPPLPPRPRSTRSDARAGHRKPRAREREGSLLLAGRPVDRILGAAAAQEAVGHRRRAGHHLRFHAAAVGRELGAPTAPS